MANEALYANLADSRLTAILNPMFLLALADRNALQAHPALVYVGDAQDRASLTVKTSEISWMGADQLAPVADGASIGNTQITDAAYNVTVGRYGKAYEPSDLARLTDTFGLLDPQSYVQDAVASSAMTMTNLIAALGSGFSQSAGSTGVNLTVQNFYSAVTLLELANATGPYLAVMHPVQWADFRDAMRAETGPLINDAATLSIVTDLRGMGYKGNFGGCDVQTSAQVPTANAGADRSGLMCARGAVLWADGTPKADPGVIGVTAGKTRLEFQRDAKAGLTAAVTSHIMGVAEGIDLAGVELLSDA